MTIFLVLFLSFLILLSAFLSASETALFSLSPLTVKSYKSVPDQRLNLISRLMERPRDVLVTILMLNTLANILTQNTVSTLFDPIPIWILKIGVPLLLTLIFGELIPKSIAMPNHTFISAKIAPVISFLATLMGPVRNPLTKATSTISRFLFFFLREEKDISSDELRHVLKTSKERGILLPIESDLIDGVLDLQNSSIKEHMRPREEIIAYDMNQPVSELISCFIDQEATRIPVYDGNLENMRGVLSARRFFLHQKSIQKGSDLIPLLKKPLYVPETSKAWAFLRTLRSRGEHFSIVVDEYGTISGVITQEDLIETVIGEISDRRGSPHNLYTRSSHDVIIASGKLELNEFEEIFGIPLESKENIVTLGGWLIEQLEDIPPTGTKYATDQFLFYVLAADPNRIRRIYVRKLKN